MSLEKGNAVVIVMNRNDYFPWQTGISFKATFIRGPQGSGDMFVFEVPGLQRELMLNGNSTGFVGLYAEGGAS